MAEILLLLAQAGNTASNQAGSDATLLAWGVALLGMAVVLFFVEVFLPSGGLLGVASGICAICGIVMMFWVDTVYGAVTATAAVIALPFLLVFALKLWPQTPFGRWVTLENQQETRSQPHPQQSDPAPLRVAVGDTGKTLTPLHPVGTCLIDGRREQCLARRGTIETGAAVRVVDIDGNEIWVEQTA